MGKGFLKVELRVGDDMLPVAYARVLVKDSTNKVIADLTTDEDGDTKVIELDAPDKGNSLKPENTKPYFYSYNIEIPSAKGYKKQLIYGVQVFEEIETIEIVRMIPIDPSASAEKNTVEIHIQKEHGCDLPKKQSGGENDVGDSTGVDDFTDYTDDTALAGGYANSGYPLANEVAIPEYVTVHLGTPSAYARNVRVPFKEYVKNVASHEIYPTWPRASLYANIYCQISFILNRINTFWYKSKGYDFDITNSTTVDQYFKEGGEIFSNISVIVDEIFNLFLRRQGRREPFFAEYCNGTTATCPGLSQWGTVPLAQQGYTPIQILHYYYPKDLRIVQSTNFQYQVISFQGTPLRVGSSGEQVRQIQFYLNRISGNFPAIPVIPVLDGVFGSNTESAVKKFQYSFNLTQDGVIGKGTWYEIIRVFNAVTKLAELTSEGYRIGIGAYPPTSTLGMGGPAGEDVVELQFLLNYLGLFYKSIPIVIQNGIFRENTKEAVIAFQQLFGLTADGIVGPVTWKKLYEMYHSISENVPDTVEPPSVSPPFPGTLLRVGSTGQNVKTMQTYLNALSQIYPSIPAVTADGVFGSNTERAVKAFQSQFGLTADGVIGDADIIEPT